MTIEQKLAFIEKNMEDRIQWAEKEARRMDGVKKLTAEIGSCVREIPPDFLKAEKLADEIIFIIS